jgi:hypothetical protein
VAIQDIHGRRCVTLSAMATLRAGASLARQGRMARRRTTESIIDFMLSRKERVELARVVAPSRRCAALSVIRAGTLPSIQLGNSLRREEVVAGGIAARVSRLINLAHASIRRCTQRWPLSLPCQAPTIGVWEIEEIVPLPQGENWSGMNAYYGRLQDLRARLIAGDREDWARELLQAERSAGTAGEALSNTGMVLRRFLNEQTSDRLRLRDEAQSIYDENVALWDGMNR